MHEIRQTGARFQAPRFGGAFDQFGGHVKYEQIVAADFLLLDTRRSYVDHVTVEEVRQYVLCTNYHIISGGGVDTHPYFIDIDPPLPVMLPWL